MPRVLCVWFPQWPIQRLRAVQPELRRTAVVLCAGNGIAAGNSSRGERVAVCSAEAARAGVAPGMPAAEARALLEGGRRSRCAAARFFPLDLPADRETLRRLCRELLAYSPHAGLEEGDAPESLLLDVTGCAHLFGGETRLLARVRRDLRERGCHAVAALAGTVGAAWGIARFARSPAVVVPPGGDRARLAALPPAALRLPGHVLAALAELGLDTVGQLASLPRASLPSRFGPDVRRRLDQAFGDLPEMIACERFPEPVEASLAFDVPLDDHRDVETALQQLLADVLDRLRSQGLGTQRLAVRLSHVDGSETPLEIGLVSPTASEKRLGEALRLTWERTEIASEVVGATLRAVDPAKLPARSGRLFDDGRETPASEWESLLERLVHRLGETSVVRIEPAEDHAPERSLRFVPVTRERCASTPAASSAVQAAQRPLCLLAVPRPAGVVSGSDGLPRHVRWPGVASAVAQCWGPERIETGWWRDGTIRRDYYRIETEEGRRLWLYCDRVTEQWFLHGTFE